MLLRDRGGEIALSRRSFVSKLAAGAAAVASVMSIGRAQAMSSRDSSPPTGRGNDAERIGLVPEAPAQPPPVSAGTAVLPVLNEASVAPGAPPPWELLRPLAMG